MRILDRGSRRFDDPPSDARSVTKKVGHEETTEKGRATFSGMIRKKILPPSNEAPNLKPNDIPHLFERFWRKSESRSEKGHSGLGLAIVAACSERLGGKCLATLEHSQLRIEIRWNT